MAKSAYLQSLQSKARERQRRRAGTSETITVKSGIVTGSSTGKSYRPGEKVTSEKEYYKEQNALAEKYPEGYIEYKGQKYAPETVIDTEGNIYKNKMEFNKAQEQRQQDFILKSAQQTAQQSQEIYEIKRLKGQLARGELSGFGKVIAEKKVATSPYSSMATYDVAGGTIFTAPGIVTFGVKGTQVAASKPKGFTTVGMVDYQLTTQPRNETVLSGEQRQMYQLQERGWLGTKWEGVKDRTALVNKRVAQNFMIRPIGLEVNAKILSPTFQTAHDVSVSARKSSAIRGGLLAMPTVNLMTKPDNIRMFGASQTRLVHRVSTKPVTWAGIAALSYGVGAVGGGAMRYGTKLLARGKVYTGTALRTAPKGIGIGLGASYLGFKGWEFSQSKSPESKGRVLGDVLYDVSAFGAGAKLYGSRAALKLRQKPSFIDITDRNIRTFDRPVTKIEKPFYAEFTKSSVKLGFHTKQRIITQTKAPTVTVGQFGGVVRGEPAKFSIVQPRPGMGETQYVSMRIGDVTYIGKNVKGMFNYKAFAGDTMVGKGNVRVGDELFMRRVSSMTAMKGVVWRGAEMGNRYSLGYRHSGIKSYSGGMARPQWSSIGKYTYGYGYESASFDIDLNFNRLTTFQSLPVTRTVKRGFGYYLPSGKVDGFWVTKGNKVLTSKIKLGKEFKSPEDITILRSASRLTGVGETTKYGLMLQRGGQLYGNTRESVYPKYHYTYSSETYQKGWKDVGGDLLYGRKGKVGFRQFVKDFWKEESGTLVAQTGVRPKTAYDTKTTLDITIPESRLAGRGPRRMFNEDIFDLMTKTGQGRFSRPASTRMVAGGMDVSSRAGSKMVTGVNTKVLLNLQSGSREKLSFRSETLLNSKTESQSIISTKTASKSIISTKTLTSSTLRGGSTGGIFRSTDIINIEPIIPDRLIPPMGLPDLEGGGRKRGSYAYPGRKRKTKYTPSLSAVVFNIRGSIDTKRMLTGLEFRPLVGRKRKR